MKRNFFGFGFSFSGRTKCIQLDQIMLCKDLYSGHFLLMVFFCCKHKIHKCLFIPNRHEDLLKECVDQQKCYTIVGGIFYL